MMNGTAGIPTTKPGLMYHGSESAFGAAARAFRKSAGTLGSGSSPAGEISSVTTSPASAPAASRIFRFTLSQWLLWPSGSSVARKGKPLMVPSTVVMLREGSFALAFFGTARKVHEPAFAVAGRESFALKRILEVVFVIFAWYHIRGSASASRADPPTSCLRNPMRMAAHHPHRIRIRELMPLSNRNN